MNYVDYVSTLFITYGLKVLYAILIWVIGKFIIGKLMLLVDKKMEVINTELTLRKFLHVFFL